MTERSTKSHESTRTPSWFASGEVVQICDAVQYPHEKLVIPRDIKPTNILVAASGAPKLLDFGIAKLLNPELVSETTPQTTLGVRLMTIEYASPEQVQALRVKWFQKNRPRR